MTTGVLAQDFCWRDSTTRGAGTIPSSCAPGTVQDPTGQLCYPPCPSGYTMAGPVCWQNCPAGYVSTGAFCHINRALTAEGTVKCTARDALGTCWWSARECPPGYTDALLFCALTTPPVPPGYSGASGLDLIRRTVPNGAGRIKDVCGPGLDNNGGLCYPACPAGSTGVGPVCWSLPPANWAECGMGAARDQTACGLVVFDQVSSVGSVALFIASLGTSGPITPATKVSKLTELRRAYDAAKAANATWARAADAALQTKEAAEQGYTLYQIMTTDSVPTDEDIVRLSATIASLADPTGVAGTVAAYTYPKCSALQLPAPTGPVITAPPSGVRIFR